MDAEPTGAGLEDALPGGFDDASLSADWSVPWSDLMMVMFVLFAVLYVTQAAEREVFKEPASLPKFERPLTTSKIYEQSRRAVQEAELADIDVVLEANDSIKLSVKGATFFELGSAELRPQTRAFLDRLALVLQRNDRRVRVIGHTDSYPISSELYPTNWELSAVRATTVVRYLIRHELDPARFEIEAHSMYRPVVPNDSLKNQTMNRRVEIVVLAEKT